MLLSLFWTPLLTLLHQTLTGALAGATLDWSPEASVTVVLSAGVYPGKVVTGQEILGLSAADQFSGVTVHHAGTRLYNGVVRTNGVRVLCVTGVGPDLAAARASAYEPVGHIHFPGAHHRRDIAERAATS